MWLNVYLFQLSPRSPAYTRGQTSNNMWKYLIRSQFKNMHHLLRRLLLNVLQTALASGGLDQCETGVQVVGTPELQYKPTNSNRSSIGMQPSGAPCNVPAPFESLDDGLCPVPR